MKRHHKLTALVLAAVMSVSMIPGTVFADEVEETVEVLETVDATESETETVEAQEVTEVESASEDTDVNEVDVIEAVEPEEVSADSTDVNGAMIEDVDDENENKQSLSVSEEKENAYDDVDEDILLEADATDTTLNSKVVILGNDTGEGIVLNESTPYYVNGSNQASAHESNYNAYYDVINDTLYLNSFELTGYYVIEDYSYGLYANNDLAISLSANNIITHESTEHNESYGVCILGSATLRSDDNGTLSIGSSPGNNTRNQSYGMFVDEDFLVQSGSISIKADNCSIENGYSYGIRVIDMFMLDGGALKCEAGDAFSSCGITANRIVVNDGSLLAIGGYGNNTSMGVSFGKYMDVFQGEIDAYGGDAASWSIGISGVNTSLYDGTLSCIGKAAQYSCGWSGKGTSQLHIYGGTFSAIGEGTESSYGFYGNYYYHPIFEGGNSYFKSSGSGFAISCSQSVNAIISGGTVITEGPNQAYDKAPTIGFDKAVIWCGDSEADAMTKGERGKELIKDCYSSKYVKVCEGTGSSTVSGFDYYKYRANHYLNKQSAEVESFLFEVSPSLKLYQDGQEEGLADSVMEWEGLMTLLNTINDPSTIPDTGLKKKDIYAALIFDIFEASQDEGVISQLDLSNAKLAKSLFSYLKQCMKVSYDIDISENIGDYTSVTSDFSSLSQVQKENILGWSEEWANKNTGFVQTETKIFSGGLELFDYLSDFEEWCNYVSGATTMWAMSDSLKNVVRDMYESCPDQNPDLKAALFDCCTIFNESAEAFAVHMTADLIWTTGKDLAQYGVSEYWKSVKISVSASNPYVALYWASYSGSKLLCNAFLSTDSISESYFTMDAILQIENILDKVYYDYKAEYNSNPTSTSAEALLTVLDTMFSCFKVDCDVAYDFVDAVDTAMVSRIGQLFGAGDSAELKAQIKSIQQNMIDIHHNVLVLWAGDLQVDYPEEYDKYSYLLKKNIKECDITYGADKYIFTGEAIIPSIVITNYGADLVKDEDYLIACSDNISVGKATMTINGIGAKYTGSVQKQFEIVPCSLTKVTIDNIPDCVYTGSAIKPVPVIKYNSQSLVLNTDYSIAYQNNINVGTATVTITGKGNYKGTISKTFKINAAAIAKATVTGIANKTYTGSALKPVPTVKLGTATLRSGTDYTVAYKNNINAGTATVTITGKGNYTGTINKTFKINTASIAKATVTKITAKTYTGKALTQAPVVKLGTKTLRSGTDYGLTYSNNKNVGLATIKITGKGNYTGTISKTFKINPKGTTISGLTAATRAFTVKWKKQAAKMSTSQITGYQIQYSTSSTFASGNKTVTVKGVNSVSRKISNLTAKKRYYVRVRTYKTVSGKNYYSAWSAVKNVITK